MRLLKKVFKKSPKVEIITDLDAILTRTVGFRFNGRIYQIKPLTLEQFALATNALAGIDLLRRETHIDSDQLIDAYANLFEVVCPEIGRKDIQEMGVQRVAALYQLVVEIIVGKAEIEAQKKSTLKPTDQWSQSQNPPGAA